MLDIIENVVILLFMCLYAVGGYIMIHYCKKTDEELNDDKTFRW